MADGRDVVVAFFAHVNGITYEEQMDLERKDHGDE